MPERACSFFRQYKTRSDFVEQARLQSLLDRAGPVQGNIFLACKLPGFGNRALDALGDKVILRLALF